MRSAKKLVLHLNELPQDYGLVFDKSVIKGQAQRLLTEIAEYKINFSVKSFPHPEFLSVIKDHIHGWDISHPQELALILPHLKVEHSVWLTNSNEEALVEALKLKRVINLTLDHTFEKTSFPNEVRLGLRIDPYSVLDKGHSKYGFMLQELKDIDPTLKKRIKYFHTHLPLIFPGEDVKKLREGLTNLLSEFPGVEEINLGGGLREENLKAYKDLQSIAGPKLVIEPGRWFSEKSGHGVSKIKSIYQKEGDLYLIGDLSPEAHMKWSRDVSYSFMSLKAGTSYSYQRLIYASSNAYENDQLILSEGPGSISLSTGDWIILENLSGYSVVWNHAFNGIDAAHVLFMDWSGERTCWRFERSFEEYQ